MPEGTSYTRYFDNVTTLANESMAKEIVRQVFAEHKFFKRMMQPENVVYNRFVDDKFFIRVRAGKATNIKYMSGPTDTIELFDDQLFTRAWFTPAILAGAIMYTDTEKEQTEGSDDALEILQSEKTEAYQESVGEIVNQNLYSDGSLNTTMGLGSIIPVNPGSYVVGQIDEAQYPFWKSYYLPNFGSWATYGPGGTGRNKLLALINATTYGQKKPNMLLTDQTTIERYYNSLEKKIEYTSAGSFGKIGSDIDDLSFMGIPFVWDRDCDPDTIFSNHTDLMKMVVSPGMNMRVYPTRYLDKQPMISYNFIAFRHQMVPKRRNVLGRADGIQD